MQNKPQFLPNGFFNIFGSEFVSRFSFWAVQSIIVLYLTKQFLITDSLAYSTAASYEALTYAATFLGGLIADKYLGPLRVLMIGMSFSMAGMLLLAASHPELTYLGLGFLVVGMGLYMPTNTSLLDHLYEKNDTSRERGFFYLYVATNVGGILGPIVFGFLAQSISYKVGFISCSFLLFSFLIVYYLSRKRIHYLRFNNEKINNINFMTIAKILFGLVLLIGIFSCLIKQSEWTRDLLFAVGAIALVFIFFQNKTESTLDRKKTALIIGFSMISLIFFAVEFQILNSVIIFTQDYVNKQIIWINVPPSAFVSLEPLFVVALAPLATAFFERIGKKRAQINAFKKFATSFIFLGFSFLILSAAALTYKETQALVSPLWLVASAIFMATGEIFLMPVLLAMVTKNAPEKLKNSLVGFLYLCIAFSSYFSGVIAKMTQTINHKSAIMGYYQTYLIIFGIMIGVGILLFAAGHYFKQILPEEHRG